MEERVARIHTSDRGLFKRCRRKWAWHSPIKQNLGMRDTPDYFWIGTGGHYAMEDYYGYNRWGSPVEAFNAYLAACRSFNAKHGFGLPSNWEEQTELAHGILDYYLLWCEGRDEYQTVWLDGEPQVEIVCHIDLPVEPPPGFDRVVYSMTLDRLVEIDGEYWILDWKFYKNFSQGDLDFDQQMSAYIWAASSVFEKPIAGAILHEFKKAVPKPPRILGSGKISTASAQSTTHRLYRDELKRMYGEVEKAPAKNIDCLNELAHKETEDRDDFIRRRRTRRTEYQMQAEGTKILMEASDMCDPALALYPNPSKDCSWDCGLRDICVMMDRDDDWESLLNELTVIRAEEWDGWRHHLPQ